MSGIVGLIGRHPEPCDSLLDRMMERLVRRGPDGDRRWVSEEGDAALGMTFLEGISAPGSPGAAIIGEGRRRLTADASIDAREELLAELPPLSVGPAVSDDALIYAAWRRWGSACTERLLGDFAFGAWDGETGRLHCARDRFGIRAFFWGAGPGWIAFSNTLDCLLEHPGISAEPDEEAVAEFLLFTHFQRPDLTIYRDIRRLPAAHLLEWSAHEGVRVRRYWELTPPELLRLGRPTEYVERFRELTRRAVADRLRPSRVGLVMSGGLDSTTVAAAAQELVADGMAACKLRACTFGFRQQPTDDEESYARAAAETLGLPLETVWLDASWNPADPLAALRTPEPSADPAARAGVVEALSRFEGFRYGLTGQGGDSALHPGTLDPGVFLRHFLFGGLGFAVLAYRRRYGTLPRLGIRKNLRLRRGRGRVHQGLPIPPWLARGFSRRLDLPGRFRASREPPALLPGLRSEGVSQLNAPYWTWQFESLDPGITGVPAVVRHPFFDLRLLTFLLSLPPVPWCVDKHIVRTAMQGRLPERVLARPKAPLRISPPHLYAEKLSAAQIERVTAVPELNEFVDTGIFLRMVTLRQRLRPEEHELITRPLGLAVWLSRLQGGTSHPGGMV